MFLSDHNKVSRNRAWDACTTIILDKLVVYETGMVFFYFTKIRNITTEKYFSPNNFALQNKLTQNRKDNRFTMVWFSKMLDKWKMLLNFLP